ncbi:proteasome assembly chaperone 2-like [Homalodisca vitripennis]|uniref:proteasome assembly chaperone 2-like n=1 Tax=Homalodisca vitripennis TaxID=197043 RepID=UPI001EEB15F2|nr:proteasome assembly chaperone 2-like [Homalodisca vitripennis]XP_046672333.1 proteasome assembly chaperone 2-like [Homalodisca vitripennis]
MDVFESLNHFKNYTLIVPAISVSNVGQLAVDLLIHSSGAEKVSNLWHEAFIPLVGAHPYKDDSTELCTEFEVYQLTQHKVLFLQFRSPLWVSKEEEFLNHLVKWFEQLEADKVIILSSLYDYERNDNQIVEPHVRCCVCPLTQSLYQSVFRSLNCRYMEVKDDADKTGIMSPSMYLPGAGFTQNLHLKCIERKIPCVSFMKFCSDGDNTPEALDLARLVDGWLNVVPVPSGKEETKTFSQPPSWKYIFGGPSPRELYP